MARFFRAAILVACFLSAGSAFAQGTCPASAPVTGTNCYFIAANGSDTNSGASESSPWSHAPGMPNCANNCAAVTPAAGKGFIFRGGDTWHFGNSGATPYTGGTWTFPGSGSSSSCDTSGGGGSTSSCIYIGVDKTWYAGSSWARPILNGDNSTSTSYVASCAHIIGPNNHIFEAGQYNIFDNFEVMGLCQNAYHSYGGDIMVNDWNPPSQFTNLYLHGWTSMGPNIGSGYWYDMVAFGGGNQGSRNGTFGPYNVCDGSDSNSQAAGCFYDGGTFRVMYSIMRYHSQGLTGWCHELHDNVFEYVTEPGDGYAHGNMWECVDDYPNGTNVIYNNVFRHVPSGTGVAVKMWPTPHLTPEYWFNNVMYDIAGGGNYWDIGNANGAPFSSIVPVYTFNNTMEELAGDKISSSYASNVNLGNNQCITNSGLCWSSFAGGSAVETTDLVMSASTSNSQGYTSTSAPRVGGNGASCANDTTPCIPTSPSNSTVGAGTNRQSYCTALSAAGMSAAAAACQHDTTDAVVYNATTHTVSGPARNPLARPASGAWDVGAYQFSSSQAQAPQPPNYLQANVQ
jgi:hypothetical protein